MHLIKAPYAAVDIINGYLIYLRLSSYRGTIAVEQWHYQPLEQTLPKSIRCSSLMTVMEHRAVHYQQLTGPGDAISVKESVQHTIGDDSTTGGQLALDYQSAPAGAHVVSAHASQVKKKQRLFAALNSPVRVVEPAFQAIIRATNYLLSGSSYLNRCDCSQWAIIQCAQPLSTCLHCEFGCLTSLNFVADSELETIDTQSTLVFYFGDITALSTNIQTRARRWHKLELPTAIASHIDLRFEHQLLPLFGNALRGFSQWHH